MTRADGARLVRLAVVALLASACGADGPLGPASNRAPQVRSVTITPPVVPVGGTAVVVVDAVDPDGDALLYHYEALAGTITADPADASRANYKNNGAARPGDRIIVTVLDPSTAVTRAEAVVSLQDNRAPVITRLAAARTCHPPCTIELRVEAEDPDGDAMTYSWSGCAAGSTTPTARCTLSTVGEVSAMVTVQDVRGGSTSRDIVLEGVNGAPVVTGGQILRGYTQARFVATASDPNGDGMTCGWAGTCLCQHASGSSLECFLPATQSSCGMRYTCVDVFGASGFTEFELHR
jgi:hypothetical protein